MGDQPRARVVLVTAEGEILLGCVEGSVRCDLGLLEGILRLRLAARRRGWTVRLTDTDDGLRALADLAGLSACLGLSARGSRGCPPI